MFFATPIMLLRGQYKKRLKTRMVGYLEKNVRRKIRNCHVGLRSEANTGNFTHYYKTDQELQDQTGKKLQRVIYDPYLRRQVLFKEVKLKGPFLLKSHISGSMGPQSPSAARRW
eukprot:PhM_4_TR1001/c0_g1_i1/m.79621